MVVSRRDTPVPLTGSGDSGDATQGQILPLLREILLVVEDVRQRLSGLKKDFYTTSEVAEALGRSEYTIRRWIAEGRLEAVRVSGTGPRGKLLVPRDQFERIVATGGGGAVPAALVDDPSGSRGEIDRPRGGHDQRHEPPQSGEPAVLSRRAPKLARPRSKYDDAEARAEVPRFHRSEKGRRPLESPTGRGDGS